MCTPEGRGKAEAERAQALEGCLAHPAHSWNVSDYHMGPAQAEDWRVCKVKARLTTHSLLSGCECVPVHLCACVCVSVTRPSNLSLSPPWVPAELE